MRIFKTLVLLFFVWLMFASAIGKLLDMPGFYAIVGTYRMLPDALIPAAAWALTLFELAMGVALAWPATRAVAAGLLLPLHVFYLVGLTQALLRGLQLPNCGCFGVYWGRPLTHWTLIEDLILLGLAVFLWRQVRATEESREPVPV